MELYHLRTFVVVAEEGHLTRAAERLFASQPAVSAHIKALEEELGVTLFTRTPRGMQLTEAGRRLRERAVAALASAEDVLHEARALAGEVVGEARLGLNTDPAFLRSTEFVAAMAEAHPRAEVHLIQCNSDQVAESLKTGLLDAAFRYGRCESPEAVNMVVAMVPLLVTAPASWRERVAGARWEDLAGLPWICTTPTCPFSLLARRLFEERGRTPSRVAVADNETFLRALVAAGNGLTLMRADEAHAAEAAGDACTWTGEELPIELTFVYLAKREKDPLVKAMVEAVRGVWGVRPVCR